MFSDWNASTSWICVPRGRPYILYHSITRTVIVWAAKNEFIQSVFKVKNHWKKRPFKRIKTVIDACAMVDIWFSFCFWCRVFWKVETCTSVLCDTALANVLSFSGRVIFHSVYIGHTRNFYNNGYRIHVCNRHNHLTVTIGLYWFWFKSKIWKRYKSHQPKHLYRWSKTFGAHHRQSESINFNWNR